MSDELAPDFRVLPQAYLAWEEEAVPWTLDEIVLDIFALPVHERPSQPIGVGLHVIRAARVRGRHFVVFGSRRADGRWKTIRTVRELPAEE